MVKLFSPRILTVGCWNIQGAYEKVNNVKINKLEDEVFQKVLRRFDILCLQETHLGPGDDPNVSEDYVSVPHCRRKSKNNRYFGGMLLLVKKSIRGYIDIGKDFDQDLVEYILHKKPFNLKEDKRIIFTYASPFNSRKIREQGCIQPQYTACGGFEWKDWDKHCR